ncbi:MAG: SGNH/GDSL hydrolase family protein [Terracidiphilus sp.]
MHRLLESPRPITWVFTGDSVTQGAKWTGDCRPYPAIFAERVRWELDRSRDIVVNTAISGNRAQDILDDFDWRVAHLHPDVVSLMIGMNDSIGGSQKEPAFAANLAELVRRIRALGAIPILHTTNTTLYDRDRADLPQYNAIIRSVAASWHVILVDNWSYWQQNRTPANLAEWLGNPIHPNGLGHIQIARQLLETLGIFDPASAVGQFGAEPVVQKSPPQDRP